MSTADLGLPVMVPSTALFTDRYELTMLQAALRSGAAHRRSVFEVFTRRLPEAVEREIARDVDATLNAEDRPLGPDGLQRALQSAVGLLCTVTDRLTDEVLSVEPRRARLLANFGVGFNHIDVEAAKRRGLAVSYTPDVLTDATADIAMTLLLTITRRAGEGERQVRAGAWTGWRPTHMLGTQVSGKTLGLVGIGRIARAVATRAHQGFDMKIIFHDPYPPPPDVARTLGAEPRDRLEQVLEEADFVSLHCPATAETRHLMGEREFRAMKPTAIFINNGRGPTVDERALTEALRQGWIAGAALDVFETEPVDTANALLAMDNVIVTPHIASATARMAPETRRRLGREIATVLQGKWPRSAVNPGVLPRTGLIRWQPYPMGRGPNR